jgi:hypothetical protein
VRAVPCLLAVLLLAACGGGAPSRLWPEQWTRHHVGLQWVEGVPLGAGRSVAGGRGERLRLCAINPGRGTETLRVQSGDESQELSVPPGGSLPLDAVCGRAGVRLGGDAGLILAEPRLVRPRPDAKTVVLILVDTLRGDHVNDRLTPGIERAFAQGRRFRDASSNAPWTLPSVASLFTSRPVLSLTEANGTLIAVPEGVPTWAEALRAAGFAGGAVVANYTVHVLNGFAAGFDTFVVPDAHGSALHPDGSWVAAEGERWLKDHEGEDRFLYLHLMDPHEPYRDHESGVTPEIPLKELAHRERAATPDEARTIRRCYASEVAHVDQVLTPFLAALPANAVVALTADHGEGLGEHGAWGHGFNLYREALHVPLLLRGPGVPAGEEERPVQLLDLVPTLLRLVGVAPLAGGSHGSLLAPRPDEPMIAATFSAGPLRWCVRRGRRKVAIRTSPQPGVGLPERSELLEREPLPSGIFAYDLERDLAEEDPLPLGEEERLEVASLFAASVGRLVPGLQVMVVPAGESVVETSLRIEGLPRLQVFAVDRVTLVRDAGRLLLRWPAGAAPGLAALGLSQRPPVAVAGDAVPPWVGLRVGDRVPEAAPAVRGPGSFLWWNQGEPIVQRGQEETVRRLRALGYLQ